MSARLGSFVSLAIAMVAMSGCQPRRNPGPPPSAELGVEQLARSPADYAGRPLNLRGVVASTAVDRHLFTVIDEAEYQACRELGCAAYEIPISFAGALPETARLVRIAGRLEQPEPGRFLLRAERVETLP